MLKQAGITTVELLLGLMITSSATYATLEMAEQAEESVKEYQQVTDVRQALKKIKEGRQLVTATNLENTAHN